MNLCVAIRTNRNCIFFFLSDNEDDNIRNIISLAKDKTILSLADSQYVKTTIYCHARYNGPNRVVEDLAVRKRLHVEIIDSSHLAVELLKSRSCDQPVRVVCRSETYPITVTSPLNCLIVGFGEVGRDSFRFLYEFGSFIKADKGKFIECKPRITAIDSKMNELDGPFVANIPSIDFFGDDFRLKTMDCNSVEFYNEELSPEKCRELNYIILALGDDDINISLATNLFNRIRRFRADMSHLIIMVRCIKDEKYEMMQKIADHYNRGCGPENLHVIRLFGNPKEIYSYDTIIRDKLTRKGITFMESYQRLRGENETWKSRREKLSGFDKYKPGTIVCPNIDKLRRLHRQENQDMANALHSGTKLWLLQEALGKSYNWESFTLRLFNTDGSPAMLGEMDSIHYPHLSAEENDIMLYLAMLEHARWNSAHEILGYKVAAKCDERTLLHNCLRPWDELDNESIRSSTADWVCDYKSYDYSTVNTSIALSRNELGKIPEYDD